LPVAQSPVQCHPKVYWIGVMPELLALHVYPKLTGCTGVEWMKHAGNCFHGPWQAVMVIYGSIRK